MVNDHHQPPALLARPRDYLRHVDGSWVDGDLTAGAPPEAELAQQVSKAFHSDLIREEPA